MAALVQARIPITTQVISPLPNLALDASTSGKPIQYELNVG